MNLYVIRMAFGRNLSGQSPSPVAVGLSGLATLATAALLFV